MAGQRSLKKRTILVFPSATRRILSPIGPESIFFTLKPAFSALLPVVPVARFYTSCCNKSLFLFKN
jgi:hypothetical protein